MKRQSNYMALEILVDLLGSECTYCGSKDRLHIHHILCTNGSNGVFK